MVATAGRLNNQNQSFTARSLQLKT